MSDKNSKKSNGSNKNSDYISDYSIVKPWGGMKNFMESYGLRIYNDEDIQEAKAIIKAFKQAEYEERAEEKINLIPASAEICL